MGRLNPSRETKFSGTHGDRGIFIFPVQLTTSRIGNLTRLIHTLLYVMTIHTYLHTYQVQFNKYTYIHINIHTYLYIHTLLGNRWAHRWIQQTSEQY